MSMFVRTNVTRCGAIFRYVALANRRTLTQRYSVFENSRTVTPTWVGRSFSVANPSLSVEDVEHVRGPATKKKFQAETQKLLDIVAKSLYSEKEVFIRELISNASDAIERLRFERTTAESTSDDSPMEIHVKTDEKKHLLVIQDTGVGMSREEMELNLGTIARSGSREFLSSLDKQNQGASNTDIIGQFGVGFYATFMVADKVEVYSRLHPQDGQETVGHRWSSTGHDGEFELHEAENVSPGTKIIMHLKDSALEFAREEVVEGILKKYSNFVGAPIYLNGRRVNAIEPIWLKDPSQVTEEEHNSFYQYLSGNTYDSPRYTLMYKTDAPINLRVLLYVPNWKPSIFDVARESDNGVALYSRKVLIMNRTATLLPKWLRFFKGVVDSEDVPLNLSRELLQDSALINRIKRLLTARVLRFFSQQSSREPEKFGRFLKDFGLYLKEGLITEPEQEVREQIAKLLRWETSALPPEQTTSLEEYAGRMVAGERTIYFLSAPSRQLAEASPYLEAIRKKSPQIEVLFLYEPYDELVLMQLGQYDKKSLRSIETTIAEDAADTDSVGPERPNCLTQDEASRLVSWAKNVLGLKVKNVKVTQRLTSHPCFVSVREAGAMRHFLRTTLADRPAEERFHVMEPILELNPEHDLVRYLSQLLSNPSDEDLAKALLGHLFDCAIAQAGLLDDVRGLAGRMNDLVTKLIHKSTVSPSP
ncbi:TNF receptor-associated protein 1, mitochondrial [Clonorchis sinensis]|uniref:TNF receptor-associated protein 1, mitochondrial n=1 Tax=Clonorchis sinensis TaxID=79923 RepID=A0A8T1MMT8_CLOSI|nr:TNF receptor-associated protein 1, mitochondrial [Clonorchis sinensis]